MATPFRATITGMVLGLFVWVETLEIIALAKAIVGVDSAAQSTHVQSTTNKRELSMRAVVLKPFAPHDVPDAIEGIKLDQSTVRYAAPGLGAATAKLNEETLVFELDGDPALIDAIGQHRRGGD